jgi:hypothetical protein
MRKEVVGASLPSHEFPYPEPWLDMVCSPSSMLYPSAAQQRLNGNGTILFLK